MNNRDRLFDMRRSTGAALGLLCIVGSLASFASAREPAAPLAGTLFLCGGGDLPARVVDEFHKLAGGAKGRLVVVTTASERAGESDSSPPGPWDAEDWASLAVRHARAREEASQQEFLKPFQTATAVWFVGGMQRRLLDAYAGTPLIDELRRLLARGGVVGGTSAGMALPGEVAILGGAGETPEVVAGFNFVRGVIFDQHFSERKRTSRLAAALRKHPGFVGLGVDEATALVIRGRELKVLGDGDVHVLLAASETRPAADIRLREHMRDDLVALSRAAIARAGRRFPAAEAKPAVVPNGSLLIAGGGGLPKSVQQEFLELAGGDDARIVVIPTAAERPGDHEAETAWLRKLGAKHVSVVDARTRAEAGAAELLAKLREADGVWFGGGRQWRFVDAYEGTPSYEAFHDVLARGGVVGGSSAGATIQGEYLVRGSPLGNTIMTAEGYERGFAFLPGAAVDQHFTQRNRGPDMLALKRIFPQLLGLGIDEATAVVVHGAVLEVLGDNTVSIYPPRPAADDAAPPEVLKPGDRYDLQKLLQIETPAPAN